MTEEEETGSVEPLLTFTEAADLLKCSVRTLKRAVASGDLVVVSLGQSTRGDRIHPDDLARFVEGRRGYRGASHVPRTGASPSRAASRGSEELDELLRFGPKGKS